MLMAKRKPRDRASNPWPGKLANLQGERTHEEMAAWLGVSLHTYLAWKYGRRNPSRLALKFIGNKINS